MQKYPNSWRWTCIVMVCILTIAIGLFACVTYMTRPRRQLPRIPVLSISPLHPRGARSSSAAQRVFPDGNCSLPPEQAAVQPLCADGVGSLGLPKALRDHFVPTTSDQMDRTAAMGEGSTSSIGHVPGCVDSSDVLLLVDSNAHLQAVDEGNSSETRTSAVQTSQSSSSGSLVER